MDKRENLDRIEIVLVDTQDGANIGSVCRAMKTMGLTHLTMVSEREYAESRVKALAIHAMDLYENRRSCQSLEEALKESVFSVAATRRRGKFRKMTALSPEQLSEKISSLGPGRVSIVFGRESDGLTDGEVASCDAVVTIASSDAFPSLNLSQAVQVITYTLFSRLMGNKVAMVSVTDGRLRLTTNKIAAALKDAGYYKLPDEEGWMDQYLHDILSRAQMSEAETQKMEKIFVKLCAIARYRGERGQERRNTTTQGEQHES